MSAGEAASTSTRRASGWIALLVFFGITSTIEAFSVSHVFRFLPLYLGTVHVLPAEVPAWTGYLNAAFFLFGLPLVPFWGVWADRYGRIPIIARSAFVEMVVFAVLWLAQNRWEAAFALLLVGFQLGNTGVMLTALRGVTPSGRVGFAISLFGVTPSLGFALGPAVGGWLVDHSVLNLHTLFAFDAVISLAAGVMLLVFAREGPRPPAPPGSAARLALAAVRLALTGRVTLIVFGVFGLAYFAQQIANPFLPLLVLRLVGSTSRAAGQIGIVFGASALLGALLSPLAGAAGDRYGFRPARSLSAPRPPRRYRWCSRSWPLQSRRSVAPQRSIWCCCRSISHRWPAQWLARSWFAKASTRFCGPGLRSP
ncbi:MAG TPA: MFS transporter [Isosphaeraceae bacterium]|nr:MFS transporter [Isosphaeraceae bacterium]